MSVTNAASKFFNVKLKETGKTNDQQTNDQQTSKSGLKNIDVLKRCFEEDLKSRSVGSFMLVKHFDAAKSGCRSAAKAVRRADGDKSRRARELWFSGERLQQSRVKFIATSFDKLTTLCTTVQRVQQCTTKTNILSCHN